MLFDPIGYNYWDYIDAWNKTFWYQNKTNRHSWLIYFKRNVQYKFPSWFLQWWDFFGPIEEILPTPADEGFKIFKSMYDNQNTWIPADLQFFSSFSLSWIHSWQYKFGKAQHPLQPPPLQRNSYVKWWTTFDASKANP
uniref:Uncharacterized protein n=1 Tax=Cajanus cajan TaxID=3821 RepID=A0A151SZW7_CAJCA|nr:hypothetical protein KK1_022756 [Cajanus cajan]